jgi:hypothetical protein
MLAPLVDSNNCNFISESPFRLNIIPGKSNKSSNIAGKNTPFAFNGTIEDNRTDWRVVVVILFI